MPYHITRTPFIPSKNSRHRIAALALYRALVKAARAVPLPTHEDVKLSWVTAGGETTDGGQPVKGRRRRKRQDMGHPVANIVRKRFDVNKRDEGTRMVFESMTVGYKFLTVLAKAQTAGSPDHAQILKVLRDQDTKADKARANTPLPPPPPPSKKRPVKPFLTRVSGPGETPKYTASAKPKSELNGPRRVPSLGHISEGLPFLRYTKPQPKALTLVIGKRRARWIKNIQDGITYEEQTGPWYATEDHWEYLIAQQRRREDPLSDAEAELPKDISESYLWGAMTARMFFKFKLGRSWEDWIARGETLYKVLKEERQLAAEEGEDVREQLIGSAPTVAESVATRELPDHEPSTENVKIGKVPTEIDNMRQVAKELGLVGDKTPAQQDFFSSGIWEGMVNLRKTRMRKWFNETEEWDDKFMNSAVPRPRKNNNTGRKGSSDDDLVTVGGRDSWPSPPGGKQATKPKPRASTSQKTRQPKQAKNAPVKQQDAFSGAFSNRR